MEVAAFLFTILIWLMITKQMIANAYFLWASEHNMNTNYNTKIHVNREQLISISKIREKKQRERKRTVDF